MIFLNLCNGTYSFSVTDQNDCNVTYPFDILYGDIQELSTDIFNGGNLVEDGIVLFLCRMVV